MTLKIKNLTAESGETTQGYLPIEGSDVTLPVTIINGSKEGEVILITAGIHGAEYPGIQTALELAKEIKPEAIKGAVIIVHPANPTGFLGICSGIIPEDGKNLNRVFPGDAAGTLADKIAHAISYELQDRADFYLDLHGGDLHERVTPYAYFSGIAKETVENRSRQAAEALSVRYLVQSEAKTGAYNSAAIRGIPSLLIERGGCGIWSREEVEAYKEDIYRVLCTLGVLDGREIPKEEQMILTRAFYPEAQVDGLWYPKVEPGETIKAGQPLGTIKDWFGNDVSTLLAESDGVVLYQTVSLAIRKGDPLVAYGAV